MGGSSLGIALRANGGGVWGWDPSYGGVFWDGPPLIFRLWLWEVGCELAAIPGPGSRPGPGAEEGGEERELGGGMRSGARPHLLSFHFVLPYLFSFFLPLPPFSLSPPSIGAAIKQITASDPFVIADP